MNPEPCPITLLDRRRMEAQIAGPLIKAFIEAVGEEKALAVVRSVIGELRPGGAERIVQGTRPKTPWRTWPGGSPPGPRGMPMKWT